MLSTLRVCMPLACRDTTAATARYVTLLPTSSIRGLLSEASSARFSSNGPDKLPKGFERFGAGSPTGFERFTPRKPKDTASKKEGAKEHSQTPKKKSQTPKKKSQTPKKESQTPKKNGDKKDPKDDNSLELVTYSFTALLLLNWMSGWFQNQYEEITMQEMIKDYLVKGLIRRIEVEDMSQCYVHLIEKGKVFTIQLGVPEQFEARLEAIQSEMNLSPLEYISIEYVQTEPQSNFILTIACLGSLFFLLKRTGVLKLSMPANTSTANRMNSLFGMGKVSPAGVKDLNTNIKISDVAGMKEAKNEVVEFIDFLKQPGKYEKLGAKIPKGALIEGPPGTGKTLLAKAIAGEADCPFYSMSGSEFLELFVGVGSSRVRDLFRQARASAPSIIYIDELDAIGQRRRPNGSDERESTLNQMLVEMDGFKQGVGVIVLASTNRKDVLDPALLRTGRFDRQIQITLPDLAERADIFMVHLRPLKLAEDLQDEKVAARMAALSPGFSGSDIANICNEAAIQAARRNAKTISMNDFERATERVIAGLPMTKKLMSKETIRKVAVHESGHAVAGWFLKYADPLLKVTIVPRSKGALGFAQYLPSEEGILLMETLKDRIAVALGGRVAEELFIGSVSSGAQDDLDKVTKMAYSMVAQLGMNKGVGLLSFAQDSEQQFTKPYSNQTELLIDREVQHLVREQYKRVKDMFLEKKGVLLALADRLEEKETLVLADLKEVLGDRPFQVKSEYAKYVEQANPFSMEDEEAANGR